MKIEKLKNAIKELKKLNTITDKKTDKNIFTVDELKTKTKTKTNKVIISNDKDFEDEELKDLN